MQTCLSANKDTKGTILAICLLFYCLQQHSAMGQESAAASTDPSKVGESSDMTRRWHHWRLGINATIFDKVNKLAKESRRRGSFFLTGGYGTGAATVTYAVTRDFRVTNIRLIESSGNDDFDSLVLKAVRLLPENRSDLAFPDGATEKSVSNSGTFDSQSLINHRLYHYGDFGPRRRNVP